MRLFFFKYFIFPVQNCMTLNYIEWVSYCVMGHNLNVIWAYVNIYRNYVVS